MSSSEQAIGDVPPVPFELLLAYPGGLSPSQVSVDFQEAYDRIPHPEVVLESSIDEIWGQRVQRNPSLYNGKKFRYAGYAAHTGGSDSNQVSRVTLHLGLTDYRTFVGTNLNPLWESFLVPSEDDVTRCKHTSSPLGNGAIVETSDGKIIVLRRSNNVGEFPGHYVFPGGHPEPEEVGISSHPPIESLVDFETNRKLADEMFDSIFREVVEEIGVPSTSLGDATFIGVSRRKLNVRPTAFFFMKCCLHSDEVRRCYSTAQDGYESTQLFSVPLIELMDLAPKMPGCHQGGFALYQLMLQYNKQERLMLISNPEK
ncbi:hypothetical protein MLD38_040138 [Melastoma candidum]|uniref:Uncharacterized protein n=1 Tax=Melastoma candidum TaxID=119954 RepID=A0ACB9L4B4_9MYRT|nr:hypothetical protein MLD38_040138 [Melastoma candidum]